MNGAAWLGGATALLAPMLLNIRQPICLLLLLVLTLPLEVWANASVEERIRVLSLQITQAPADYSPLLQRALAYAENQQPALALSDILAAEALGDPIEAALVHGILLFQAGDYAAARPYLDRYLQAYPRHRIALDYRARLLRDSGEFQLALDDYEVLLAGSHSLDAGYYLATARMMAWLPERGTDDALSLLDSRMAEVGPISPLQRYAVQLEVERGAYDAALTRMAALDQKLRGTAQWQLEMAELLLLAGRPDQALQYLDVAQEQLRAGRNTEARRSLWERSVLLHEEAAGAAVPP